MNFWGVVFVVFMCLWLVLGVVAIGPGYTVASIGHALLPWACVAILGYAVFGRPAR